MRYFSALCARMYRLSANSRATISSTAIFFSQQSRQYRSSPRGSETSFAAQSAHLDFATFDLRGAIRHDLTTPNSQLHNSQFAWQLGLPGSWRAGSWELAPWELGIEITRGRYPARETA